MEEALPPPSRAEDSSHAQQDDDPSFSSTHADARASHMQGEQLAASSGSDDQHRVLDSPDGHLPPTITEPDPPTFWIRHGRSISTVSYHSITGHRPHPILLEDHSEDSNVLSQGCWAKSVSIDDYTVVAGPTGIGAYVVWHCTVGTLKGGDLAIRKRYSEFDQLRADLVRTFPHAQAMIPRLPRKSVVSRFRPRFLEQRRAGLGQFMNCVLLNPEFAASPVLKEFIFS